MSIFKELPAHLNRHLLGDGLRAYLLRGGVGSGGLKIGQALLTLSSTILLARALGPEGYGLYAFAFSLVSLLAIPAQMGLPMLLVREVARYQLKGNWGHLRGLLRRANQAVLALSIILLLTAVGIAWMFTDEVDTATLTTIAWASLLMPLIVLGKLRSAALRGLRKVVQGQLPETLLRPGLLLVFAAAVTSYGSLTPSGAMALHALAATLAFIVGAVLLMRAIPPQVRAASPAYETAVWARSLLPLSLITGMQAINNQADIVLLGFLTTTEAVGIYRIAVQGATIVSFSLMTVSTVIGPQIARLYYAGDMAKLQRMITLSSRVILAFALPLSAALIIFGAPLLQLVFGQGYSEGHIALAILCIGHLANATMGTVAYLLNMTGHEQDTAKALAIAALSNIVLNLILIPYFGIEGAALATTISLSAWNIQLYRQVKRRIGIDSLAFPLHPRR